MTNILCYGDSNTWGYNPDYTVEGEFRLERPQRWTGLVQQALGEGYYVIEEGLGGRTTVFNDPSTPGRSGLKLLAPLLHSHQPLDLVVFMLGTNDTKVVYGAPVVEIALGMEALVKTAQNPYATDRHRAPEILIISPILVQTDGLWEMFDAASVEKAARLAGEYRRIAALYGCHFMDAALHAKPSPKDGIHLNAAGHAALGPAVAEKIREIFG